MVQVGVSIDFLQHSIEVEPRAFGGVDMGQDFVKLADVLYTSYPGIEELFESKRWSVSTAHLSPYSHAALLSDIKSKLQFANVFFSSRNINTILIQHTGQGCDQIPHIVDYIQLVQPRVGRIDVAIDVVCDEQPEAYYAAYGGKLSKAFESSPTGQTFYLGSRKSDKFMRIYRYAPPHERAHLLRFEIQYRREFARAAAWHITQRGMRDFALAALAEYGLDTEHITGSTEETFIVARRKHGDTLRWLDSAVRPAILKLVEAGELDARAWIEDVLNGANGD